MSSTPAIAMRLATEADRAAIEAIIAAAYAIYIPRMGRKPMPMLDDYAALIGESRISVLTDGATIVGLVDLVREPEAMLLNNIAVHPDSQGKGFGRRLLEFAEEQARSAGYRAIRLLTNKTMTDNQALYARIGYVETHRDEAVTGPVFMTKTLG